MFVVPTQVPQTPEEENGFELTDTGTQMRGKTKQNFSRIYFTCVVNRKIG